ncbi:MAG: flagellar basal body-associated FliL family protein [Acidobacteriota bacterium]|nr:flagellar basal body-associated FliL family protein [Acidobacteriota bacterium]MDQ7088983.1 flagellar basal body-associated FliL family protein [Acidobacteriota bacterium]
MADEKKEQEEQTPKKGKMGLIIIIAVAALVVLGGGGAAMMFMMGGSETPAAESETGAAPAKAEEQFYLATLDTFVVNLADPKGDRFMKATLRVVVTDPSLGDRIRSDDLFRARLRDKTLSILSSKQFKDVSSPLGKESLRRELTREFSQIFPPGSVKEVLFVEFIIQ